jgi:hypothetical protein
MQGSMKSLFRAIVFLTPAILMSSAAIADGTGPRTVGADKVPASVIALFHKTFNLRGDIGDTACIDTDETAPSFVEEFRFKSTWTTLHRKVSEVDRMNGITSVDDYSVDHIAERKYRLPYWNWAKAPRAGWSPGGWTEWGERFVYGIDGFSAVVAVIDGKTVTESSEAKTCKAYVFAATTSEESTTSQASRVVASARSLPAASNALVSVAVVKVWTSKASDGAYLHAQATFTASHAVEIVPADFRLNFKLANGASTTLVPLSEAAPSVTRGGVLSTVNSILSLSKSNPSQTPSASPSDSVSSVASSDDFGAIGKMTLPAKSPVTTVMTFKLQPSQYTGGGVESIDYVPQHGGS